MAKQIKAAYVDACCFCEAAAFDAKLHCSDRERDMRFLRALFEAAFDGEVELYTSSLTVAECQFVRARHGDQNSERIYTDEVRESYRTMLTSGSFVILIQDTVLVGEQARDLLWVHNLSLPGGDAVHVASAIQQSCEEFITFDEKHIGKKKKELYDLFGLRVVPPSQSSLIPPGKHPEAGPLFAEVAAMKE